MRVWAKDTKEDDTPKLVTLWAVYFNGLTYLGPQSPKEPLVFTNNALIFGMNWGFFTAPIALKSPILFSPSKQPNENAAKSYNLSAMCRLLLGQKC